MIYRLAHGMRLALGHSTMVAQEAAMKNAIAAAITSEAIQKSGGNAFEGFVNVAGTFIRVTGALTFSGVVVGNVMGAAHRR